MKYLAVITTSGFFIKKRCLFSFTSYPQHVSNTYNVPRHQVSLMKFDNVLLIDDDEIYNLLHTRILYHTRMVSTIWTSYNGEEAISFLTDFYEQHKSLPSMILLDIDMPVMDGFQFLTEFRKLNLPGTEKVNILLVTSSSDPRDAQKARSLGIKYYLVKPVELDVMTGVLLSLEV